jgi:hypothetical protein
MLAIMPVGQVAFLEIETRIGGELVQHEFPFTPPAIVFFPGTGTSTGQQVRLYPDPGTVVSMNAFRNIATGEATFTFSASGHLVNVP